jgi:hypothetical protein
VARNVGPIQVAMAGLYGMLGVKDGSNPDIITGFVQPTLDAGPWWLRATTEQLASAAFLPSTGAIDSFVLATMPPNEWWHIAHLNATLTCDTATISDTFNLEILIQDPQLNIWYRTPYLLPQTTYGAQFSSTTSLQQNIHDLWVPPQSRILVQWLADAGGPDNLTVSPIYGTRCRV